MRTIVVTVLVATLLSAVSAPGAEAAGGTVTAVLDRNVIAYGQNAWVRGATNPPRPGGKVAVERRLPDGTWSTRAVRYANGNGDYGVPLGPTSTGIYALRVRTTVGYSAVFYLRVLPPLLLDAGGLPGLRIGMSKAQAVASHWLRGTDAYCPYHPNYTRGVGQLGVSAGVVLDPARGVISVGVGVDGRTVEGLRVMQSTTTIAQVYPSPTWSRRTVALPGGEEGVVVSKAGRAVYAVSINNGKVTAVSTPGSFTIC